MIQTEELNLCEPYECRVQIHPFVSVVVSLGLDTNLELVNISY
jgi:hypothetical protein